MSSSRSSRDSTRSPKPSSSASNLPRELDCIELGASIGVTGCHIRRRLAPDKALLAVEALPDLAELARVNLERNHSGARWDVVQAAIWYGSDQPRMRVGAEHTQGTW